MRNEQAVQCAPDQLGALLAQLASLVAPGKNRSFALSFSPEGEFNDVHHMMVFLEKSLEKGAMALKVSVYDPELSGDTSHLRVLPEHLVQLSFHDFDLRHAFHPGTVDILNLMLDDAPLARSLTEKFQFVPENSKVLVSSVLNALAYGNQYGLEIAANRLAMQHPLNTPIKDLNDRSKELGQALRMALVDNRADAIHVLKDSILLMGPLTSSTVKEMVREAESGLPEALEKGAVKAMKAWEDLDALVDSSADLDEQGVLVPDVSRGLGGALRQGVGDVTDIFVRVFGKPRQSLSVREIRDFLLGQAKERRMRVHLAYSAAACFSSCGVVAAPGSTPVSALNEFRKSATDTPLITEEGQSREMGCFGFPWNKGFNPIFSCSLSAASQFLPRDRVPSVFWISLLSNQWGVAQARVSSVSPHWSAFLACRCRWTPAEAVRPSSKVTMVTHDEMVAATHSRSGISVIAGGRSLSL